MEPCIQPYYPELELLGSAVGLAPRLHRDIMNPPILLLSDETLQILLSNLLN